MRIAAIGGAVAVMLLIASHGWVILAIGAACGWLAHGYSERRRWQRFRGRGGVRGAAQRRV